MFCRVTRIKSHSASHSATVGNAIKITNNEVEQVPKLPKQKLRLKTRLIRSRETGAATCWSWKSRLMWFLAVTGLRSFCLDAGSSPFDVVPPPPCTIANLQYHHTMPALVNGFSWISQKSFKHDVRSNGENATNSIFTDNTYRGHKTPQISSRFISDTRGSKIGFPHFLTQSDANGQQIPTKIKTERQSFNTE